MRYYELLQWNQKKKKYEYKGRIGIDNISVDTETIFIDNIEIYNDSKK